MANTNPTIEAPIANVELRPIIDYDKFCVVASLHDADYFGAYSGAAGEPVCRDEIFNEAGETLDEIFGNPKYADARRWYNGNEICIEITCADDVFNVLADVYCVEDEEYAELGEKLGFDATKIAALTDAKKAKRS